MWTRNRHKLIKDLSASALGLIEEAEYASPEQARDLVELASSLDRLRVTLMTAPKNKPIITRPYISIAPANCA